MKIKSLRDYAAFSEKTFKKQVLSKNEETVVFRLNFLPGQVLPQHNHPGARVYLLVLEGTGMMQLDEQQQQLTEDDVVDFDGNALFGFTNTGTGKASLYVVLTKMPEQAYAEEI
ncbi:cupin domain-containing protein [Alkalicoccus chagannorensis]|uniref:cupin domain-containing protein n=1 Tax=Alkalicoccus chagannorensis TaxID=427072 RepID=UPI00041C8229|nr:cupin domain-containing protein [Alkalicoccus chagannorensis]